MSASRQKATPLQYMAEGQKNVLWKLEPRQQSDVAFHSGADIRLLSQFAEEDEVLFPPCTMLSVLHSSMQNGTAVADDAADAVEAAASGTEEAVGHTATPAALTRSTSRYFEAHDVSEGGKSYLQIKVMPSFI